MNLIAFSSKFTTDCSSRVRSASTRSGPAPEHYHLQLLFIAFEQGPHDVDGLIDDLCQVHRLPPKLDPAACDARDVEQIVDDAAQTLGLSLH